MQMEFFTGVVVDIDDPERAGRVRVRDNIAHGPKILDEDLQWAQVILPVTSAGQRGVGNSPTGLEVGSWVLGLWADGQDKQIPLVLGSISGRGDLHPRANELNSIPRGIQEYYSAFGSAYKTPDDPFSPQYPYNTVIASKNGNIIEMDDTEGATRLNIAHNSGSFMEFKHHGELDVYTKEKHEENKSFDQYIEEDRKLLVKGDSKVVVNGRILYAGNADIEIISNEQTRISSKSDIIIEAEGDITLNSEKNINVKSIEDVNIEGKNINLIATSKLNASAQSVMDLKSNTINFKNNPDSPSLPDVVIEIDEQKYKFGQPAFSSPGGFMGAGLNAGLYVNAGSSYNPSGDTWGPNPGSPVGDYLNSEASCSRCDLGEVSARFESRQDPGTAVKDNIGNAYGTYQINTATGTMTNFFKYMKDRGDMDDLHQFLESAGGVAAASTECKTTAEVRALPFAKAWREAVTKFGDRFVMVQHDFIKATHFDKQVDKIKKELKIDICDGSHSKALQEIVWSVATQFGPGTDIVVTAIRPIISGMKDKIQSERKLNEQDNDATRIKGVHGGDPHKASDYAKKAAASRSLGKCARYIRIALQTGGKYKFSTWPISACDYARTVLPRLGWTQISGNQETYQKGDIMVYERQAGHPHGHIQIYDGKNWVSDFVQKTPFPWSPYKSRTVWRDGGAVSNAPQGVGTPLDELPMIKAINEERIKRCIGTSWEKAGKKRYAQELELLKNGDLLTRYQPVAASTSIASGGADIIKVIKYGPGWNICQYADGSVAKRVGVRNWRNNNPGNLVMGAFSKRHGAVGSDGRFAIFPSFAAGFAAQQSLVIKNYGNKTIPQMLAKYAPSFENDTSMYIRRVLAAVGGDKVKNKLIRDFSDREKNEIISAMIKVEGFKVGNTYILEPANANAKPEKEKPQDVDPETLPQDEKGPSIYVEDE